MYVVWDSESSKPVGFPINFPPENDDQNWLPLVMPEPRVATTQHIVFELIEGKVVGRWDGSPDPLDSAATADEIKQKHRELETQPVLVFGTLLDADERSEKRIEDSIIAFDDLPLEAGLVEIIDGEKVIFWKDAQNNSSPLTKVALQTVLAELIKQRAIRATALFKQVQELKVAGATIRQVRDWVV